MTPPCRPPRRQSLLVASSSLLCALLLLSQGCKDNPVSATVHDAANAPSAVPSALAPAHSAAAPASASIGPRPFDLAEPIGFAPINRPARAVCTLETGDWKLAGGSAVLFPAPDARAFASVHGGAARLFVVPGRGRVAGVLEAESSGIFVRGLVLRASEEPDGGVATAPFPLHTAHPMVFGGVFVPKPTTPLAWSRTSMEAVVVQPATWEGIKLLVGGPSQTVPCNQLSLDAPSYDPLSVVSSTAASARRASLGKSRDVELSTVPGGPVVARVTLSEGFGSQARVLEEQGENTRIAMEGRQGFVFGWVRSTLLAGDEPPDLDGFGFAGGVGQGGGRGRLRPVDYVCPHDVRLLIDQTATTGAIRQLRRYVVGGYRAGTTILASEPKGERTAVQLPGKGTKIGFHFDQSGLVFGSELEKCRVVEAKPVGSARP